MTGHCAPACHCACSPSTFVPAVYNPALFTTITSSSSSTRTTSRPSPAKAPLISAEADSDCPGWLCGVGLAGLVVAAVILFIIFI